VDLRGTLEIEEVHNACSGPHINKIITSRRRKYVELVTPLGGVRKIYKI
jgi:hypothetical protein